MTDRSAVKLSDMKRAIKAARESGLDVKEVFVTAEGVRVICSGVDVVKPRYDDPRLKDWPED